VKTFRIGSTAVDLPAFLETRVEDDTLVANPPRANFANLRFTVITVTKDGKEFAGAGERLIRKRAAEAKAELHLMCALSTQVALFGMRGDPLAVIRQIADYCDRNREKLSLGAGDLFDEYLQKIRSP